MSSCMFFFFFFKQKTAYEMRISEWSSDVCSSDLDLPHLKALTEAVHANGSLAAIELVHNGQHAANHYSREVPMGPSHRAVDSGAPVQARAMDKADIANFRRWPRKAALRAPAAGFDRSADRAVGKGCVSQCRSRWTLYH